MHTGLRVIDPALAAGSMTAGPNPLTAREREVLLAARNGATIAATAKQLSPRYPRIRSSRETPASSIVEP
ncbi:hypothetical protein [Phytomonospora endophytica]|uniref:DNA-binding NarL/FixJ family response regulator n=1 Tax=Phytomonospora endophytica TaxID=714109 RepID=A0A841FL58_9ACTN|nr:DNA-binding NarL/FixJ family response regulator [Phytomonospora endophytica]